MKKWTKEKFIKELHNRCKTVDYEVTGDYEGSTKPLKVKTEFGECVVRANHLLNCINPTIITALNKTDYWVKQAKKIHSDRYDYKLSEYVDAKTPLKIICKLHGCFEQTPDAHVSGSGCKECAKVSASKIMGEKSSGWGYKNWEKSAKLSKNFDSFKLYIIKCWNEEEEFYKVGRTFVSISKRFCDKSRMPYKYDVLKTVISSDAKYICDLELSIKMCNSINKYKPLIYFKGEYECFKYLDMSCFEKYKEEIEKQFE